jgi:methylenetetrahydrofolate reductase (NADPH)
MSTRLIDRIKASVLDQDVHYSFEFFPPTTERGRRHLERRIDHMADMQPCFVDVTCSPGRIEETLSVARDVLRFCGVDVMMRLTGRDMTRERLNSVLREAQTVGLRNIFCDGDDVDCPAAQPPSPAAEAVEAVGGALHGAGGLRTLEMVRQIRLEFGELFTVAVAAVPEVARRPGAASDALDRHVRDLCELAAAGADLCLTEPLFDTEAFFVFSRRCRAAGLARTFPVVPGVMPIHSLRVFDRVVSHLHVGVPEAVRARVEELRAAGDARAVAAYGLELAESTCLALLNSGMAHGLHFYTLNLESPVRMLLEERLKIAPKTRLPWRPSANPLRQSEDVRPIFWANRPKSYLMRTEDWGAFPRGRWGTLPPTVSFSEVKDASLFGREAFFEREDLKKKAWGEAPFSEEEVFAVFAGYIEGRVPFLPWCEESLHLETSVIRSKLIAINRAGFLTINSQPRINAAPSSDTRFGWGPAGGYVYQKAYIEFFTSPQRLKALMDAVDESPAFGHLVYHAVDVKGNTYTNSKNAKPCAVTWGVFPGKEVKQPTVVDPAAFLVWKDEAFALWVRGWASIYADDSPSYNLLYDMHDNYFLVSIVDNDFIAGDIFAVFDKLLKEHSSFGPPA